MAFGPKLFRFTVAPPGLVVPALKQYCDPVTYPPIAVAKLQAYAAEVPVSSQELMVPSITWLPLIRVWAADGRAALTQKTIATLNSFI
jgi:hypothetical protein